MIMAKQLPHILFLHPEPGNLAIGAMMEESEEGYQNCMHDLANHTKICKEAKSLDIHTANVEHDHAKQLPHIYFLHPEPGDLTIGCHNGRLRGFKTCKPLNPGLQKDR
jgi:hypothetical protein